MKKTAKGLKALTVAVINKLQNYFAMALRVNTGGTVQKMADAICASFLHVASNEKYQYQSLCDKSWCQYRREEANKRNLFRHRPGLPNEIVALVKPTYKDLVQNEELSKCLHRKTQNQNESFNSGNMPQRMFIYKWKIRFAVYDAVAVFSDKQQGFLNVIKTLRLQTASQTTELCCMLNLKRKMRSSIRLSKTTRIRRRILRAQKKSTEKKGVEGNSYKPGFY